MTENDLLLKTAETLWNAHEEFFYQKREAWRKISPDFQNNKTPWNERNPSQHEEFLSYARAALGAIAPQLLEKACEEKLHPDERQLSFPGFPL